MSQERRKSNKQSTGTVPKIKYQNNTSNGMLNEGSNQSSGANNLILDWHRAEPNFVRNAHQNTQSSRRYRMEAAIEGHQAFQNDLLFANPNLNGSASPNSNSSVSRRSSSGTVPKCDNVSKYPVDKKQVEDKLNQIREYLRVTTALMLSVKPGEDRMVDESEINDLSRTISELKDSESKLLVLWEQLDNLNNEDNVTQDEPVETRENGVEYSSANQRTPVVDERTESLNDESDILKEQQLTLLHLQQKAENRLRDARNAQEKLLSDQRNYMNNISKTNEKNYVEFDDAIKELEERTKQFKEPRLRRSRERVLGERMDLLQNQLSELTNANNERQSLIHIMDSRDAELRSQHVELQGKLAELQSKKQQVDELVAELQVVDEPDEDDVGTQVKKIVSMKEQLAKLKDMLEVVQNTENIMLSQNNANEDQEIACGNCIKTENFLQKENESQRQSRVPSESNFSNTSHNENPHKQLNKNSVEKQGARLKQSAKVEKLSTRAELESKRRELESLMGKHKAGTSNLNHDVNSDRKIDFCNNQNVGLYQSVNSNGQWASLNQQNSSSDRYSSDEFVDENEYSEMNSDQNQVPPIFSLSDNKYRPPPNPHVEQPQSLIYDQFAGIVRSPDHNSRRSTSISNSEYMRNRATSNNPSDNKNQQVQKQLELIKSVCESMLEQQISNCPNQQSNVQQLRNNLSPSPVCSEPRRLAPPNQRGNNALNVINSGDCPFPLNNTAGGDSPSYQNFLTTNALQTQAFMMNTLNQCCQMLWLQQRELVSLKNVVTVLQERLDRQPIFENVNPHISPMQNPVEPRSSNLQHSSNHQKVNQVSAAYSMPNLNHYNLQSSSNISDPPYNFLPNNMQTARLLDPCLNNNVHLGSQDHNNLLHLNANGNHLTGQAWNGHALNNQVAPGNRANNYWDNFRSYSRQNLLSSKNNEGFQNLPTPFESRNTSAAPFALVAPSKSNSEHESSTSQENTPRRLANAGTVKRTEDFNKSAVSSLEALNVNHGSTTITEEVSRLPVSEIKEPNDSEQGATYQAYLNALESEGAGLSHVKITGNQIFKDCIPENCRRKNEWRDDVEDEQQLPKAKPFEELRENVYKEVANLISANEDRPHFLIQLFRDLQMISSDSSRLNILQSIQGALTHSAHMVGSKGPSETTDHMTHRGCDFPSLQPTVWSKTIRNSSLVLNPTVTEIKECDLQETLKGLVPFLNDHEEEIIQSHFLVAMKEMLINSNSFREAVKDTIFQKHFSHVLDEVLEQFQSKRIKDVKGSLIHTLNEILKGELSFIELIQDTYPDAGESVRDAEDGDLIQCGNTALFDLQPQEISTFPSISGVATVAIQNEDLAEADQSRMENDDIEEEGAVGGLLEVPSDHIPVNLPSSSQGLDLPGIDFSTNSESESQFVKQGLDQVPTRLQTKSKSRSNTPNRDRSSSSRSEHHPESF